MAGQKKSAFFFSLSSEELSLDCDTDCENCSKLRRLLIGGLSKYYIEIEIVGPAGCAGEK